MALGFTTSSAFGSLTVLPDRGFTREATQSVQTISFGDGYEQRVAVGINSTKEVYNLTFANRTKMDIDNIAGFLNSTGLGAGLSAFGGRQLARSNHGTQSAIVGGALALGGAINAVSGIRSASSSARSASKLFR